MTTAPTRLEGTMFIGAERVAGDGPAVHSADPATGDVLEPAYRHGGPAHVDRACALAEEAFDTYRATTPGRRALFLENIADRLTALTSDLAGRAHRESGLPLSRTTGEVARAAGQLRLFAEVVREGSWHGARIDPALPDRTPLPRPDIRQRRVPLGPVAVFGASNFPLAFSVAGGDTAAALAAGCPVVVKAHDAHLGTSELVAGAIRAAVTELGLPDGVFSLLLGDGPGLGTQLVTDSRIAAVGFTGSRAAGLALARAAAARPVPIPVHAEMSSINPVVLMPGALDERAAELGAGFVGSLTLGAGQFCTNPGLVVAVEGRALETFLETAGQAVESDGGAAMLTEGISRAYAGEVAASAAHPAVATAAVGAAPECGAAGRATLLTVAADALVDAPELRREMFGAAALVVRCRDLGQVEEVLQSLEGQLTATVHTADSDLDGVRRLLPLLERRAGRLLFNGWPTGVEVGHAMVHGGPFPATSDGRSTSVGSLAIERFLRPVAYQNTPAALLPEALHDSNPYGIPRRVDGELG